MTTETGSLDRSSVAKPVSRRRPRKLASASALAVHRDCSRAYIDKLEGQGVIQRQGSGFPLDESRVAYLRYLRRERRQSPRTGADADHVRVKTEMLQLRLMQRKHELVPRAEVDALHPCRPPAMASVEPQLMHRNQSHAKPLLPLHPMSALGQRTNPLSREGAAARSAHCV